MSCDKNILAMDIGSTFTKVTAIDTEKEAIIGTAKAFTTIETNVEEGINNALEILFNRCGKMEFQKRIASSSAAGGLKMISCGLVPELTVKAAKMAAASAGAKVLKSYSYELNSQEQQEIKEAAPDIILLSGGIDGGNKNVILHNDKRLAEIEMDFCVIVAGNKSVSYEVAEIITGSGKTAIVSENVMPEFNVLNIPPAKKHIRDLFIERIIQAKGLDQVQKKLDGQIIPTPLAVFEAAEILSKGFEDEKGLGDILVFDVGGATTDVYSMADGSPTKPNVVLKGLKEPFAKRTVEGDIGVRYSISSLIEEASAERIAEQAGVTVEILKEWERICKASPGTIPEPGTDYSRIDNEMAAMAVEISANRHCGIYESVYTPFGETFLQTGKDLTGVKYIIGGGGSVVNSPQPGYILKRALFSNAGYNSLKPLKAEILLDKSSILTAMGLLSRLYPQMAVRIMRKELAKVDC